MIERKILRLKEAAHIAGASAKTLTRMISAGHLTATKLGKGGKTSPIVIHRDDLMKALRGGKG